MIQKLYDYRSRIAYKALCVAFMYFCDQCEQDESGRVKHSDLIALAKKLAVDRTQFIFKGMEDQRKVSLKWIYST